MVSPVVIGSDRCTKVARPIYSSSGLCTDDVFNRFGFMLTIVRIVRIGCSNFALEDILRVGRLFVRAIFVSRAITVN